MSNESKTSEMKIHTAKIDNITNEEEMRVKKLLWCREIASERKKRTFENQVYPRYLYKFQTWVRWWLKYNYNIWCIVMVSEMWLVLES